MERRPLFSEWAKPDRVRRSARTREDATRYRAPHRIYVVRSTSAAGHQARVLAAPKGAVMTEREARASGAWPVVKDHPIG